MKYYIGIDVGTGSARVGIFNENGRMVATEKKDIQIWSYDGVYKEQSSTDIWNAVCSITKKALSKAGISPESICGIGFDATCSLVALDKNNAPVSLSKSGDAERNIILWMDHRADKETEVINKTDSDVLNYTGGKISIEMEIPKLMWIKNNLPESFNKTALFLDLPDFLVYKACGQDIRSSCSLTCKWTYLNHEKKWDDNFFKAIGLDSFTRDTYVKIGNKIADIGSKAGVLTEQAAKEMGLIKGIPVGVSMIDAHAGGVGVIGVGMEDGGTFNSRLALIGGTSNCHMAVSEEKRFIGGVWGPYYSVMLPHMWLTEGGQSAAGVLVEHLIKSHPFYSEFSEIAKEKGIGIYDMLNDEVAQIGESVTKEYHILPYHHGNRSPRANPNLKGMISGLTMDNSLNSLVLLYISGMQAVALGTRHIIETLNENGYEIKEICATGGVTKNPQFMQIYSNITKCKILTAEEEESVLLGSAILGAAASGDVSIIEGMRRMSKKGKEILPDEKTAEFYDRKYKVFIEMYNDQIKYKQIME